MRANLEGVKLFGPPPTKIVPLKYLKLLQIIEIILLSNLTLINRFWSSTLHETTTLIKEETLEFQVTMKSFYCHNSK